MHQRNSDSDTNQEGMLGTMKSIPLSEGEFQDIRKLVYDRFGINLTPEKKALVVARLSKVVQELGYSTFAEYVNYLKGDASGHSIADLANRISTNFTYFNREQAHFEFFVKTVLPQIEQAAGSKKDLRIWSAGCSSGEEPYMLVMLMKEYFGIGYSSWNAGVLATDISDKALTFAREGIYPDDRITHMPDSFKKKYFNRTPDGHWAVKDEIKKEVTFRRFNLMNPTYPFKSKFHTIFCRNVMIYFDQPTRDALVKRYFDNTVPGGYLFIGHSETLRSAECPYDYVIPAVYHKPEKS